MPKEYYCEVCNYKVDRKSSYEKHIVSAKHHIKVAGMVKETQVKAKDDLDKKQRTCVYCDRLLLSVGGKNRHEKKCKYKDDNTEYEDISNDEVNTTVVDSLDDSSSDTLNADLLKVLSNRMHNLLKYYQTQKHLQLLTIQRIIIARQTITH